PIGELAAQHRHHIAVALDGDHSSRLLRQPRRQRPQTSADLDDDIVFFDATGLDDRLIGLLVDEKVLPPALLGVQAVLPQQLLRRHNGSVAVAFSDRSARSPRARRWVPAQAIIAALSVQRGGGGTNSSKPSCCDRASISARSPLLQATPPASTTC